MERFLKTLLKKNIVYLLILSMVLSLSLTGCGKEEDDSKNHVFDAVNLELPYDIKYSDAEIARVDDSYVLTCPVEDYSGTYLLVLTLDKTGGVVNEYGLTLGDGRISKLRISPEGMIVFKYEGSYFDGTKMDEVPRTDDEEDMYADFGMGDFGMDDYGSYGDMGDGSASYEGDGEALAGDGEAFAGDGEAFAGDGEAFAGEGESFMGDPMAEGGEAPDGEALLYADSETTSEATSSETDSNASSVGELTESGASKENPLKGADTLLADRLSHAALSSDVLLSSVNYEGDPYDPNAVYFNGEVVDTTSSGNTSQSQSASYDEYGDEWGSDTQTYIVATDYLGNDIVYKDIDTAITLTSKLRDTDSTLSVSNIFMNEGKIYVCTYEGIAVFDEDLNLTGELLNRTLPNQVSSEYHYSYLTDYGFTSDGRLVVKYSDSSYKVYMAEYDLATNKLINQTNVPDKSWSVYFYPGLNGDFSIYDNYKIYDFSLGTDKLNLYADFSMSDVPLSNLLKYAAIDDESFYGIYTSFDDDQNYLALFNKIPPSEVKEREVLTLATLSTSTEIKKAVSEFNSNNQNYRINIVDYMELYGGNTTDSYNIALSKLNTDIISGNMPDILQVDSTMPINTYINKGLLCDISEYIEKDPDIDISDFNEHILSLYRYNGGLYQICPSYNIYSLMVWENYLEEGQRSWSLSEALKIQQDNNIKTFFPPYMNRENAVSTYLSVAGKEFFDYNKGKAFFDTDEFKEFLRFAKSISASEPDWESKAMSDYFSSASRPLISGKALVEYAYIYSPLSYQSSNYSDFAGEGVCIGFPTSSDDGNVIFSSLTLAMSSKSEHTDVCYEFIKYFLTDEYQEGLTYGLPIKNSVFDAQIEEAKTAFYQHWTGFDGTVHNDPATYYEGDEEKTLPPFSDEEAEEFVRLVNNVSAVANSDQKIMSIIKEEMEDYFNDRATEDEVSSIIQSRVQLYLYEIQ